MNLRDLVFLYTNGGHDQSVRISLENKLRDRQVMPVKPKQNTATQAAQKNGRPLATLGSAPTFSVKVSSDEAITQPDAIQAQSSETKVSETTDTVEQKDAEFEDHVPEVVAKATASPAGDAVEESAPAQAPAEEQAAQHGDILERIKTIKAEVNEKAGNPVHLVDLDPQLGREYMSALLEAMKKVNSGSRAADSMARLEAARDKIVNSSFTKSSPKETEPVQPQ